MIEVTEINTTEFDFRPDLNKLRQRIQEASKYATDQVTCHSFLAFVLGFDDKESYRAKTDTKAFVTLGTSESYNVGLAKKALFIGIRSVHNEIGAGDLFHVALIDPDDSSRIVHRRKWKGQVKTEPGSTALDDYLSSQTNTKREIIYFA